MGFRPVVPPDMHVGLRTLMEECWLVDPERRPSFDSILARLRVCVALPRPRPLGQAAHCMQRGRRSPARARLPTPHAARLFALEADAWRSAACACNPPVTAHVERRGRTARR